MALLPVCREEARNHRVHMALLFFGWWRAGLCGLMDRLIDEQPESCAFVAQRLNVLVEKLIELSRRGHELERP